MTLIDERGRLLRRWNVIDVASCLLVIGLLWSVYAVVQVSSGHWRRRVFFKTRPLTVELQVIFLGLDQITAHEIRAGDIEVDPDGHEVARILEVSPPQRETLVVRFGNQDWFKEIPNVPFARWEVPVRFRVLCELRGDVIYHEGRYVGSGARIAFRTPRYTVRGFIYDEGWVPVLFKTEPLTYEQASRLVLGAQQTDSEGQVVARFRSLEQVLAVDSEKRLIRQPTRGLPLIDQDISPHGYQLVMWVELQCTYYAGTLSFQGAPVELGKPTVIHLGDMMLKGTVNSIGPFQNRVLTGHAAPGL